MRGGAARRWWPAACYALLATVLTVVLWQSSEHLTPGEAGLAPRVHLAHGDNMLGPWMQWDGLAYHTIADQGYPSSDIDVFRSGGEARVAFFPGYPLLGRALAALVGDTALSLILVTVSAGLGFTVLFHRWLRNHLRSQREAAFSLLALLLFPWAYFLAGAAYGEALFLLCTVGAFLLLEDDRPLAAGLLGAVAAGTRIVGVAVVVGLALRALERRGALRLDGWRPRLELSRLRRADGGVVFAASGLLAYVAFCWVRYGDPIAFSTAQRGWGSGRGVRTWFKLKFFDLILHSPDFWFVMRLALHGLIGLGFCLAIPAVWRRFGPAYGMYTLVVVGLPMLGSGAFQSMGRHMLTAFPVFALLGERLAAWPERRAVAYLVGSGAVLLVWTSFWGRGYWMG